MSSATGLRVENLSVVVRTGSGPLTILERVSFELGRNTTLAIVGESGSGKTSLALAVLGLLGPDFTVSGRVIGSDGEGGETSLLDAGAEVRRAWRGRRVGMMFQEPLAALDPTLRIGDQLAVAIGHHFGGTRAARRACALAALAEAGMPEPESRARAFPHELSGGLRARAVLAAVLSLEPGILIADEPTAALDLPGARQLIDDLLALRRRKAMSLVLITHDLALARAASDDVLVMRRGRIVERLPAADLPDGARDPYTRALFRARPSIGHPGAVLDEIPADEAARPADGAAP